MPKSFSEPHDQCGVYLPGLTVSKTLYSPEAILQGCRERERYEYDAIARMCRTCKEQGIETNESKFMHQVSSLLEMSANASDEDLRAMVEQTNKRREYFNYTHNLRLSPWAYLVYIAGRDRFLWK